eukprot:jgi/Bigna1/85626/estExt_fgenesh1_pg.C_50074
MAPAPLLPLLHAVLLLAGSSWSIATTRHISSSRFRSLSSINSRGRVALLRRWASGEQQVPSEKERDLKEDEGTVSAAELRNNIEKYVLRKMTPPPDIMITKRASDDTPEVSGLEELGEDAEGCWPHDPQAESVQFSGDDDDSTDGMKDKLDDAEKLELEEALKELQGIVGVGGMVSSNGASQWRNRQKASPSSPRATDEEKRAASLPLDSFDDFEELDMSIEDEELVGFDEVPVIEDTARDYREEILSGDKFWGDTAPEDFRSGFVSIIGSPNMGKSTLMNALVGENLSIVSPKAQTTRHRIMGIISDEKSQMIYWDTPGILKPNYMLQERMLAFVYRSISDADVLLIVTDVDRAAAYNKGILERIRKSDIPIVIAVNKIDLLPTSPKERESILEDISDSWKEHLPDAKIFYVSAKEELNIEALFQELKSYLPTHPPWFDQDTLTDRNERFFVSELVRGQIFELYHQEIPYSCEVTIKKYKDFKDMAVIEGVVHADKESQKRILIGKKGSMIKKLSMSSRQSIEEYLQKKVHLSLEIKVSKDWRTDDKKLRGLGYYNA